MRDKLELLGQALPPSLAPPLAPPPPPPSRRGRRCIAAPTALLHPGAGLVVAVVVVVVGPWRRVPGGGARTRIMVHRSPQLGGMGGVVQGRFRGRESHRCRRYVCVLWGLCVCCRVAGLSVVSGRRRIAGRVTDGQGTHALPVGGCGMRACRSPMRWRDALLLVTIEWRMHGPLGPSRVLAMAWQQTAQG